MSATTTRTIRADLIRQWPPKDLTAWKDKISVADYGVLYSVYADLVLANSWSQMQIHNLASDLCPLIAGTKPSDHRTTHYVYCSRATHSTSIKELSHLFDCIHARIDKSIDKILLGIVHTDSTVVYYTLNNGMTKPTVN